jgi:hypothetical protein
MRQLPRSGPAKFLSALALTAALATGVVGCDGSRAAYPTASGGLTLTRVVLYRNGIGYFERVGEVEGELLTIKVRKDQVNDLLKSLTVVEARGGKAVSVSMPLDPQSWANAALATLAPGRGNLAEVLDALRGTRVTLSGDDGSANGRIAMVEEILEPAPPQRAGVPITPPTRDHKVTLLDGSSLRVVKLSRVKSVKLEDGDLALQFNRTLDASAGEGMFEQVDVAIRLAGTSTHELLVSYVVQAPMWKPTYRVVLPKEGKGKALLQAWAVVDNTSGEDWRDVGLSLTSGAPIAFRYDLHTPRDVPRADLTESGVRRQAHAAVGETTWDEAPPEPAAQAAPDRDADDAMDLEEEAKEEGYGYGSGRGGGAGPGGAASRGAPPRKATAGKDKKKMDAPAPAAPPPPPPMAGAPARTAAERQPPKQPQLDFETLRRSTEAKAAAAQVSGLDRYDLKDKVTVPDGTSTMVAIVNDVVQGEETFLFRPGGAGVGFEASPYRVVRFKNTTPFALEPGPISIYAGGSFVGEGLSETVGAGNSATIPFAVEPSILVSSTAQQQGDELRLVKLSRGVLECESFARKTTTWTVKGRDPKQGFTVLVRHPKAGWNYELSERPEGTEDLADAYLLPVKVPAGKLEGSLSVTERTPSNTTLSIWDVQALPLLEKLLVVTDLGGDARQKLQPIVDKRREIARFDEQIDGLRRQRDVLDQRAQETRQTLVSIEKDKSGTATQLRQKLTKRLEDFGKDGDRLGREMAELESKRLEKRIELEDALQSLEISAPKAAKGTATPGGPPPPPPPPPPPVPVPVPTPRPR